MARKKKTVVRRISSELDDLIDKFSKNNNDINYSDSTRLVAKEVKKNLNGKKYTIEFKF